MRDDLLREYSQIRRSGLKETVRSAAISALYLKYSVLKELPALLRKERVQFIYFHHVFNDEEKKFDRILAELAKDHIFISHSEAVRKIHSGMIDKPYMSVSFDDGFKNCVKAAEIMDRYGIKSCFFVSPPLVGEKDPERIKKFCREKFHKPPVDLLDWDDIEKLLSKGHEIGSHGMTHSRLSGMDGNMLAEEITRTFGDLKKRIGDVRHFSWPFGKFSDFSEKAAKAVFDSGFVSCSSAQRGCHVVAEPDMRRLCIRRDHIIADWPMSHVKYFIARSSGAASAADNAWPVEWKDIV